VLVEDDSPREDIIGRFHHTREVKVGILLGLDDVEENVGKVDLLFGLKR